MAIVGVNHHLYESSGPTVTSTYPVRLSDVKDFANVTWNDDDTKILRAVKSAISRECDALQFQIPTATYKLELDEFPDVIELRRPPVNSVTSITYLDTDGVEQTLASSVYRVLQTDVYNRPGLVVLDYNQNWPNTRGVEREITVTFQCGYASGSVPLDAQMLIAAAAAMDVYGCDMTATIERFRNKFRWEV